MKSQVFALLAIIGVTVNGQVLLDPCIINYDFKIVVLGSSTAAGAGTSNSDSAWVNRYRNALKAINPGNTVINLAVGGYTTYRIMPNAFVTPSNRPMVDTLRNVTAALKLNPDAIIINLPSNDRQWPMQEQLNNFDSLFHHSWNSGVPLFVCTTQPIQPISAASYQRAVRDSIMANYGQYAIDLFLPLAALNSTILPQYAADAVHLNDTGHGVVFQQVWNADVLGKVFHVQPTTDLAANEIIFPQSNCADSVLSVGFVLANLGDTALPGLLGWALITGSAVDSVQIQLATALNPCAVDTIWTSLNTGIQGNYMVDFLITHPADTITHNNSISSSYSAVIQPKMASADDTLCLGESTTFSATMVQGDTILWYASLVDTLPFAGNNSFSITKDTVAYAQAVTGPLLNFNALHTTNQSNITFNGNMFNIMAKRDLTLESIRIRSQSTGQVPVRVYLKSGIYQGFEQSPMSWNQIFIDTLSVLASGDSILLDIRDTNLIAGDTLAIYVHMANSNQQLLYQSYGQSVSYESDELIYYSGSGIAFNFGNDFPNRVINAQFTYSYGVNLLGQCATQREPVYRIVAKKLDLGLDTSGPLSGIWLSLPSGYTNPVWTLLFTGDTLSTQPSLFVDSTLLFSVNNQIGITCFATDHFGCRSTDTIFVTLNQFFEIEENQQTLFTIYPNPANDKLIVQSERDVLRIQLLDLRGRLLQTEEKNCERYIEIPLDYLAPGNYLLRVYMKNARYTERFVKY